MKKKTEKNIKKSEKRSKSKKGKETVVEDSVAKKKLLREEGNIRTQKQARKKGGTDEKDETATGEGETQRREARGSKVEELQLEKE